MIHQKDFNVLLKGLYSFHFFVLTGTLLHKQIPMLITFCLRDLYYMAKHVNLHFSPLYYNHVPLHSAPLRVYTFL
jgi:hypothetical protein